MRLGVVECDLGDSEDIRWPLDEVIDEVKALVSPAFRPAVTLREALAVIRR
jgi:hypothetical protein